MFRLVSQMLEAEALLTERARRWQEVPIHRRRVDSWPRSDGPGRLDEDDAQAHHPERQRPLHPEVQCVFEELLWDASI